MRGDTWLVEHDGKVEEGSSGGDLGPRSYICFLPAVLYWDYVFYHPRIR